MGWIAHLAGCEQQPVFPGAGGDLTVDTRPHVGDEIPPFVRLDPTNQTGHAPADKIRQAELLLDLIN